MPAASPYRRALAAVGFFTLLAGDAWRYLLGWWGWGAIVGVLLVLTIVEIVRARASLRRAPLALIALLAWMALSIAWSAYPGASALGVLATLVTTSFAVFAARVLRPEDLLEALARAARAVLALSLLFELVVAFVIRRPVLPLWVDWSALDRIPPAFYWSRNVLLEGDRIQGIVGNANLLAFAALLGLVVFAVEWVREPLRRVSLGGWILLAVLTLALTRSSTVLIAAAGVAVLLLGVLLVRRAPAGRRALPTLGFLGALGLVGLGGWLLRAPILAVLDKSPDLTERVGIWGAVLELAAERPVLGWGWVSYWAPWVEPFRDLVAINGVPYYQAHDAWIDVLFQLGAIGLVLFALFVLTVLARTWGAALAAPSGRELGLALLPLLLVGFLLVHSIAESRLLIEIGWALLVWAGLSTAPQPLVRRADRELPEDLAAAAPPGVDA